MEQGCACALVSLDLPGRFPSDHTSRLVGGYVLGMTSAVEIAIVMHGGGVIFFFFFFVVEASGALSAEVVDRDL